MSLGHGYDMVLLPPRHPTDEDYELSQPRGALCRYRRSRQARAARRRRARRNRRLHLTEGGGIPRSGASQPDANPDFLIEGLCRMRLAEGKMPTENSAAPPSGETPPLPGPTTSTRATISPSTFPFGLDTVARAYASSVSTNMSAYEELPGHHLCSTLDLFASTPASEYLDSMETPETEPCVTASQRCNHGGDLQQSHIPHHITTSALLTLTRLTTPTIQPVSASTSTRQARQNRTTRS
jgi:hypothetical protein